MIRLTLEDPKLRSATFGLVACLGAIFLGPGPGAAATGESSIAVGIWDLKLDGGGRQCRLVLRADAVASGHGIGMPAACHLAFPFLTGVRSWSDGGDGKLQFQDAKGETLLAFAPGTGASLTGTGPEGEALRLDTVGVHRPTMLKASGKGAAAPAKAVMAEPAAKPAVPRPPIPTIAEMAGHYAVLRKLGKDTGCMVTLDEKARGPGNALKANLAPACRDQGIVIFDPVGWQLQGGQLVLTARKGHFAKFDLQTGGEWTKDGKAGASLSLKRM